MLKRKIALIVISLGIAAAISFFQYNYFKGMAESDKKIQVAVAKSDITTGEKIDGNIEMKIIPQSACIEGMYLPNEKPSGYAKTDISKGTYIFEEMVSTNIVPVVKDGMRRVSVSVNLTSSIAGKIRPGEFIDIGFIEKEQGAKLIANKVQIYEVVGEDGKDIYKETKDGKDDKKQLPAVITLILTPEQATALKGAESSGKLFCLGY